MTSNGSDGFTAQMVEIAHATSTTTEGATTGIIYFEDMPGAVLKIAFDDAQSGGARFDQPTMTLLEFVGRLLRRGDGGVEATGWIQPPGHDAEAAALHSVTWSVIDSEDDEPHAFVEAVAAELGLTFTTTRVEVGEGQDIPAGSYAIFEVTSRKD